MKKIVFLIALLIPLGLMAQVTTVGNFKIENQELIYQKVFTEDSITLAKLEEYYKTLPYLASVTSDAEGVKFELNNLVIDYKKFGFSQVGTPTIIQSGLYSGKGLVAVKNGKYRVTLQGIQMTGDIGYKKITTKENLTNYATQNSATGIHQNWNKPNMLGLLDQAFTDKLQYVAKKKSDF